MPGLDPMILGELQQILHDINPYVNQFRQAGNLLKHNPSLDLKLVITNNRTKDPRRYNTPNASEVAAIMIGNGQEIEHQNRDIVLQPHEGNIKRISELHCAYTPLHYVLMFPKGKDRWHPKIPIYNKNDNISIHDNNNEVLEIYTTTLHYFGRLFQQWIVDIRQISPYARNYNTPNASEVAAIMIGNGQEIEHQNRDIVLQPHEGNIKRISELHCAYTPLHYVLMFPRGEDGWHPKIPIYNKNDNISIHGNNNEVLEIYSDNDETDEKYVTAMNYFAYQLQIGHPNEATTLHYFGQLFQQ
ncbi:hypothetical protein RhiirC2_781959 [Rhizophagus irregularis]|uniref:Helitron helicase-like domain-containing protein n=1 Tax=Rhizophagus irregularis TaxID=588596 RepID=A0A2N1N473_9GLOM|nr:hypothetical protein RhiirC2_781959 [Rhizophagus irregularis]